LKRRAFWEAHLTPDKTATQRRTVLDTYGEKSADEYFAEDAEYLEKELRISSGLQKRSKAVGNGRALAIYALMPQCVPENVGIKDSMEAYQYFLKTHMGIPDVPSYETPYDRYLEVVAYLRRMLDDPSNQDWADSVIQIPVVRWVDFPEIQAQLDEINEKISAHERRVIELAADLSRPST
jgi:hypothetical protein